MTLESLRKRLIVATCLSVVGMILTIVCAVLCILQVAQARLENRSRNGLAFLYALIMIVYGFHQIMFDIYNEKWKLVNQTIELRALMAHLAHEYGVHIVITQ